MKLLDHYSNKVKHASLTLWAILFQLNSFWLELSYFITLSILCFLTLKSSKTRSSSTPKDVDLFFTAVSAATVSSMSTLEMEVFSNAHLLCLTIFMFAGGEVFTSMLQLHLTRAKIKKQRSIFNQNPTTNFHLESNSKSMDELEEESDHHEKLNLKLKSIKILAYLISCYLLLVHAIGSTLISLYVGLIPTARKILKSKQIKIQTFAIFTTVSTFANCGFIPTNENMIVFKKNSGLLLILIPQIVTGNTLYPVFLRLAIWLAAKTTKREEFSYMLKNWKELGYGHLLSPLHSVCLAFTALGFVVLQFVVFCSLEWNSGGGGSGYEKAVAAVFQVVNSRHAGESVFDLSAISSAVLLMFVFMMYLPPYTSYLPIDKGETMTSTSERGGQLAKNTSKMNKYRDHILFSQLTYLSIFIILICITERRSLRNDPLNFNVLNIVLEVISAYGNVGFTVGYSCARQINPNGECKDSWSGFAGRWSTAGKFLLIVVMFFGRMKKFSRKGGRAWVLL